MSLSLLQGPGVKDYCTRKEVLQRTHSGPPRMLGVLLCYNDADILADAIEHLILNGHDLVVWDHGSSDATPQILERYRAHIVEHRHVPRDVDFYGLYQAMSQNLIEHWAALYDWISWPDQDEILEGPDRSMGYASHVARALAAGHDWVQFNNYNYWWTPSDSAAIASPVRRVRHYALFGDCSPRIRAWRAARTNIRLFNHNPLEGHKAPVNFNLRHYPMRSEVQMQRRLDKDRADLQRGALNYHYANMNSRRDRLTISAQSLHRDDGLAELDATQIFDWRQVYGRN